MGAKAETEVKFYLLNLSRLQVRLEECGALLVQPRVHELNLRFDTPQGDLGTQQRVLRLRKDQSSVLTYKGPSQLRSDVNVRQEIEFAVSDFDSAKDFLEALGYQVVVIYEKYRTTYLLNGLEVTLDEMPYGDFAEIEGENPEEIKTAAKQLGLTWNTRIIESYIALFERVKANRKLTMPDLIFDHFTGMRITPKNLGVLPADSK